MADGDEVQTTGVEADTSVADTSTTDTVDTTAVVTNETSSDATVDTAVVDDAISDASADAAADDSTDGEGSQTPPDAYADFVMPEGVQVDEALLNEALPIFKDLGLNQDQAQKLVDFQAAQVQAGMQKQVDAFNDQKKEWLGLSTNDKEFGGDKFDENVKIAQSAVNRFGTPELKQLLDDYGVGNHPEIVRFMVKVGRLTAEDVPGNNSAPAQQTQDTVNLLYPNDRNK